MNYRLVLAHDGETILTSTLMHYAKYEVTVHGPGDATVRTTDDVES